ncbi:SH3 domain-containing protein [Psychroserpens sp. NJDZ02]|uniref:SH3 domain-containing protein n=1 Tax=Psychroserpens sp. NJDZ02 TaxID=2570561 RepID=UPI0010A7CD5E|nr:SH3 domain-containing protein [Psychroserpens sp. NJDZ02]QCE42536.1 SH3 domain-containing protein [Psychroserpens sp. NJDZ02]
MRNFLTLIFILLTITGFSQSNQFQKGEEVYLFGDNVRLRSKPSTKSEVIELVSIGSKLQIIDISNKTHTYKGITSPWYLVNYNGIQGYVVGGLISIQKIESLYSDAYYLFNIAKSHFTYYNNINIRLIQNNKIIDTMEIKISENDNFELSVLENKNLTKCKDIILINQSSKIENPNEKRQYQNYIGIVNNAFVFMGTTKKSSIKNLFDYNYEFIFSSELKDNVKLINKLTLYDENKKKHEISFNKKLNWNGSYFLPKLHLSLGYTTSIQDSNLETVMVCLVENYILNTTDTKVRSVIDTDNQIVYSLTYETRNNKKYIKINLIQGKDYNVNLYYDKQKCNLYRLENDKLVKEY